MTYCAGDVSKDATCGRDEERIIGQKLSCVKLAICPYHPRRHRAALNISVHDDATRLEKVSDDEPQRSRRHDTLGEMSDVEQQRSRSAVDLRKSSTKCRSTNTTDVDSPSSDNVLSSFQKGTRAKLSQWPVA